VTPAWGRAPAAAASARSRSAWQRLRVTPKRAAIAATILVALGVTLTRQRIAPEAELDLAKSSAAAASAEGAAPMQPRDALFDSAVKRNVDAASPPRGIQAAPGPQVAVPLASERASAVLADTTASSRVAAARGALRAQADSPRVESDRAAVVAAAAGAAPAATDVDRREMAASRKADAIAQSVPVRVAQSAPVRNEAAVRPIPAAAECYRVESANGTAATWGTVPLPLVVALDSVGRSARVNGADGSSDSRAIWSRGGDDSLTFQLRRIGYTGTLTLGGTGDVRPGVMRSAPAPLQLSGAVTTGTAAPAERAGRRRATQPRAPAPAAAPTTAPTAAAPAENAGTPATAVVARRVSCGS
jgi:hypothetical protein